MRHVYIIVYDIGHLCNDFAKRFLKLPLDIYSGKKKIREIYIMGNYKKDLITEKNLFTS